MPVIRGTAGADTLIGTEGNDYIYGYDGIDRLEGGAGDDRLYGGAGVGPYGQMGVNTLVGGAGNDRYYIQGSGNTTIEEADGGLDRVYWMPVVGEELNWYVTQPHVEYIYIVRNDAITDPDDFYYYVHDEGDSGDEGFNHTIFGSDQSDAFAWNSGRDVFYGGDGDDWVGAENSYGVVAGQDNLRFFGGAGDDGLSVGLGMLYLSDLYGNGRTMDYIHFDGGAGMDYMEARSLWIEAYNVDTIQFRLRNVETVEIDLVDLDGRPWSHTSPFDFTMQFITTMTEPPFDGPYDMSYDFLALGHNVRLGATHDYAYIQGLNSDLDWGAGQFVFDAGAGNDRVDFDAYASRSNPPTPEITLAIRLGAGNDMALSTGDAVTITGGAGNDYIEVNGSNNALNGGLGDDEIYVWQGENNVLTGGAGDDVLRSEGLNDRFYGGVGDDIIIGGDGDDLIYGGAGADQMRGGAGADRFVFLKPDMGSTDTIMDFSGEEGDIIDLRAMAPGLLVWRGSAAFTGTANEVRVAGGRVEVDADGDGVADLTITIGYNLSESDFWL